MPTLFLFDERCGSFSVRDLNFDSPLPYAERARVLAADFSRCAQSDLIWTTRGALESLGMLAGASRIPFSVRGGFRRIAKSTFPFGAPQHAGLAFHLHVAHPSLAIRLARTVRETGAFPFVSPLFDAENEIRVFFPCRTRFQAHDAGTDVLALQDAMLLLGCRGVTLSGKIDAATRRALCRLQRHSGRLETGIPDWEEIRLLARLTSAYQRAKMGHRILFCTEEPHGL